ncbi:unnamed protein product [Spirodela intermedia]|uniref:Uncharacterized protein n=2 Tax=Spirodela intermedia TaxID=51605 RepID=A0A7I8JSW0_SPIIN|nr:unnamed protein product [Spirodela intermedia]CAA6672845.1 unnamed protein product [Spirodela intermedia]CAA7410069.1 unnamed protein product [Spirodela intermedia]
MAATEGDGNGGIKRKAERRRREGGGNGGSRWKAERRRRKEKATKVLQTSPYIKGGELCSLGGRREGEKKKGNERKLQRDRERGSRL